MNIACRHLAQMAQVCLLIDRSCVWFDTTRVSNLSQLVKTSSETAQPRWLMMILHSWIRRQPFMANENETNWSILAWMQRYDVQPPRLMIDHAHRGMESHIWLMKGQHLTNSYDYLFTILPGSHFIFSNPAQAIRICIQASWVRCHHAFECDSSEAWQVSSAWDGQLKSAWHLAFARRFIWHKAINTVQWLNHPDFSDSNSISSLSMCLLWTETGTLSFLCDSALWELAATSPRFACQSFFSTYSL